MTRRVAGANTAPATERPATAGLFFCREMRLSGAVEMPERPTGTVTFLFSDIEGSTRLLQQLRDRYDEVLSTHARLLRAVIDEIDGLPSSFPSLRTAQASAFEGREGELARAAEDITRRRFASRRAAALAAAGAVIAAAVVIPLLVVGGSSQTAVAANSIAALDSSGSIAATVSVGARPVAITSGAGALWPANLDDESVTRVDWSSRQAVRSIPIGDAATALAATRTAVWVTDGSGRVLKIDPRYNRVTSTRSLAAAGSFLPGTVRPALAAFGSIW